MNLVEAFRWLGKPRGDADDPMRQEAIIRVKAELDQLVRFTSTGSLDKRDIASQALVNLVKAEPGLVHPDFVEWQWRRYLSATLVNVVNDAFAEAYQHREVALEEGVDIPGPVPRPGHQLQTPPTETDRVAAWRLLLAEIAPAARPEGEEGLDFDRDLELLVAVARAELTRKQVIAEEHAATLKAGKTSDTLKLAADRVDKRMGRLRQRLVEPAFDYLRKAGWFTTPQSAALAQVLVELGCKHEWFSARAAEERGAGTPGVPRPRRRGADA